MGFNVSTLRTISKHLLLALLLASCSRKPVSADIDMAKELQGKLVFSSRVPMSYTGKSAGIKMYVLYTSASWCGPCRAFTPQLVRFYQENQAKHPELEVILLSADRTEDAMYQYMRDAGMDWPALRFGQSSPVRSFMGSGIPCLVVVDETGKILCDGSVDGKYFGAGQALNNLKKLLANSPPIPAEAPTQGAFSLPPNVDLMTAREKVMEAENLLAAEAAKLQPSYRELQKMHANLKPNDQEAVFAYNEAATRYSASKQNLDSKREDLADMQAQMLELIDEGPSSKRAEAAPPPDGILLYTTSGCVASGMVKEYFSQRGISYRERNIETSRRAYAEWTKFNLRQVPILVIKGEMIRGFDKARIDQLLPAIAKK